ncbi:hypothetical protein AVEN_126580-1 [Araneus ventricosus]|uniref:Integrase catalytic domain-containing protein n=1 Tax=Araneus ventricosus TaxID=182803 RepID=A0A4Y2IB71_ARAVE|nr:hypothetical protein AVEN_126580-1 [Araneus ventricosus]
MPFLHSAKRICKKIKAPVQKIPTADYPFQKGAFDAMGPFITSSRGNKYLIVISDYLTRYAEAYPTPDIQGSTAAHVLIDFISRHLLMQTLYSDRGSNFLSDAMMDVYAKLGIPNHHTLAFNPQGNGLVERLNKTLVDSLSHLVSEKQEDWCQHVPLALMAFRSAYHRSIQETSDFLVYGRDPVMPYDLIFSDPVRSYSDTPSYVHQLVNRLQSSFASVKQHLENSAEGTISYLLDIRERSAPIHLDHFAKDCSNFQFIHLGRSFTKSPTRTTGRCDCRLLLLPPSKEDACPALPPLRVVFTFVREARSPSRRLYFSFTTECAKWKTIDVVFPMFPTTTFKPHRIFALYYEALQIKWKGAIVNGSILVPKVGLGSVVSVRNPTQPVVPE